MTQSELYYSVAQLGFEDSLGDDGSNRFIYAANRALLQVSALRPAKRRVVINHKTPKNLLGDIDVIETDKPIEFRLPRGKALYVEVSGSGAVQGSIEYQEKKEGTWVDGVVTPSIYKSFTTAKIDVITGLFTISNNYIDELEDTETVKYNGIKLTITPNNSIVTIKNIAIYDAIYGSSVPSYNEMVPYDINAYVTDFERFDTSPIIALDQDMVIHYDVDDKGIIYLPRDKGGEYTVSYIHKVTPITSLDNMATKLDLDEDLAALLPNLIAAYVWLDDETEKAQFYLNLYMQQSAEIERRKTDSRPVAVKSAYGWW